MPTEADLERAATTAIEQCLAVAPEETCVIVYDTETERVADALEAAAGAVTPETVSVRTPVGETHGAEPPAPVAAALREADVFLAPTARSLSHTRARQRACEAGARGSTLPGITPEVFAIGLDADYAGIEAACSSLLEQVADAEELHITTDAGTDVTVEPGGREWHADTGMVHDPGAFSNLPAGEVFVSPHSASGTVVIDGTMRPHGLLETPIELTFVDGQVTDISDPQVRETVESAAADVGEAAYNVAELGIGANDGVADLVGSVLLDEKAAGTVHMAIGDDASIGGDTEAPIHLDGVVRDPTITADGIPVELPSSR